MRSTMRFSPLVVMALGAVAATGHAEPTPPVRDNAREAAAPTGECPAGMVLVRGGTARVGAAGDEDALPPSSVEIADYCIDRTEVTVTRYEECVTAGRCARPETRVLFPDFGPPEPMRAELSRYCNAGREGAADHPINCIDHATAASYCSFRGAHLPSEIEWEYAARGAAGAPFPWGERAPVPGAQDSPLCWDRRVTKQGTCAAGQFAAGATRDGALDMAGNVWEWTSGTLANGDVARGGGWTNFLPRFVKTTYRWPLAPTTRLNCIGFRCAAPVSSKR